MTCWTAVLLRGTTRLVVPIDVDTSESWCAVATYRVVDDPAGEVREDHGADGSQGPRPFAAAAEAAERARAAYFADEVVGLTCDTPQPAAFARRRGASEGRAGRVPRRRRPLRAA